MVKWNGNDVNNGYSVLVIVARLIILGTLVIILLDSWLFELGYRSSFYSCFLFLF